MEVWAYGDEVGGFLQVEFSYGSLGGLGIEV